MKLIPAWQSAWRFWSVQLATIGSAIVAFATAFPDAALQAWLLLPQEFKTVLPPAYIQVVGIIMLVLSILARVVKQPKVEQVVEEKRQQRKEEDMENNQTLEG